MNQKIKDWIFLTAGIIILFLLIRLGLAYFIVN